MRIRFAHAVLCSAISALLLCSNASMASASTIKITKISGKDAGYVTFTGSIWKAEICANFHELHNGYAQIKVGNSWTKLAKTFKSGPKKNAKNCSKKFPYFITYTHKESVIGTRQYRILEPTKSGFTLYFTVTTSRGPSGGGSSGGGSSGGGYQSKLAGCQFEGKKLYGSVYFTNYQSFADFTVYVSSYQSFSDLSVYMTNYSSFANSCGTWYRTDYQSFADFTVYVSPYQSFSDFTIYYTDYSSFAGLN